MTRGALLQRLRGMDVYDRVDQFHQNADVGDAITAQMLSLRTLLRDMGYESDLYTEKVGAGCESEVRRISQYRPARRQLMLWHFSIGVDCFELVATARHDIAVIYHNITPAELISEPSTNFYLHLGRQQLRELPDICVSAVADSNYNRLELLEVGFRSAAVLPVWSDGSRFVPPESAEGRRSGDWLFVGRMVPSKRQVELVRSFGFYQRTFDRSARLILVGYGPFPEYVKAIHREIAEQGLTGRVEILGKVDERELLEVMWSCAAYVSLSEHEGFGVPLLEAMAAGLAVFAVGSGAVAETIGDAGVLLAGGDPPRVAAAVASLLGDKARLDRTRAAQRRRVKYFETFDRTAVLGAVIDECSGLRRPLRVAVQGPGELVEAVSAGAGAGFDVSQAATVGSPDAGFADVTVTSTVEMAASDLTSAAVGIYRSTAGGGVLTTRHGEEVRVGQIEGWPVALESLLRKAYRPRVGFVDLSFGDGDVAAWFRDRVASLGAVIVEQPVGRCEGSGDISPADAVEMSLADVVHVALDAGSFEPAVAAPVIAAAGRSSGVVVSIHGDPTASRSAIVDALGTKRWTVDSVIAAGDETRAALKGAGVTAHLVDSASAPGALADLYREAAAAGRARRALASSARRYALSSEAAVSDSA